MPKQINIKGQYFGEWEVISYCKEKGKWLCKCSCGTERYITSYDLRKGHTKSCGHIENLINKKFGNWIVISEGGKDKSGRQMWLCECSCKNHTRKIVGGTQLKNGKSVSCGCLKGHIISTKKTIDITGQKFGKLTVLEHDNKKIGSGSYWSCKCECGNIISVSKTALVSHHQKTCGCEAGGLIDLTGKIFGKWKVIKRGKTAKNGQTKWLCKCKCGTIREVVGASLVSGSTKSCGCNIVEQNKKRSGILHPGWKGGISSIESFLRRNISLWKKESMNNCNYKCVITNKHNVKLEIHHLYPFNKIVKEVFNISGLHILKNSADYTQNQLNVLSNICLNLNYKYGLGVVLSAKLHKEFHKKYGIRYFTVKNFQEFYKDKTGNNFDISFFISINNNLKVVI